MTLDITYKNWIVLTAEVICRTHRCEDCKEIYGLGSCPKLEFFGTNAQERRAIDKQLAEFIKKVTQEIKGAIGQDEENPFGFDIDEKDVADILLGFMK